MFLRLLELFFLVTVAVFFTTQVWWPLWQGRALFPLFGKRRRAEEALAKAREREELRKMFELSQHPSTPQAKESSEHGTV